MEKRSMGGQRNKYLISSRGCSVHIYSKKKNEKKVGQSREEGRVETGGWKDKWMDTEAGFGEHKN